MLKYKVIDVMKLTKDSATNPMLDVNIQRVIDTLKSLNVTHIAISVPMDYPDYAKKWAGLIHQSGLKVLHRGTWNGIEGLYGVQKMVGVNRPPNAAAFWLDKTIAYINGNPELFADGDLWGVIPERTEGIFQDATSFLPHEGGIQTNYANFFNQLVDMSKIAFANINKAVEVGFTANNFTEVDSGWIPLSLFTKAGNLSVDHYVDPSVLEADLRRINTKKHLPVFHQEWGTIKPEWDLAKTIEVWKKLSDEGLLIGVNYWGGWAGTNESILNADFTANDKGKLLGDFFKGTVTPEPEPVPEPEAEKIISAEGLSTIVVVTNKGNLWKYSGTPKVWSKLPVPSF